MSPNCVRTRHKMHLLIIIQLPCCSLLAGMTFHTPVEPRLMSLTQTFFFQGTVIIIANHGDRIDIPAGAMLENKIVSGNLRILDHWGLLGKKTNPNKPRSHSQLEETLENVFFFMMWSQRSTLLPATEPTARLLLSIKEVHYGSAECVMWFIKVKSCKIKNPHSLLRIRPAAHWKYLTSETSFNRK